MDHLNNLVDSYLKTQQAREQIRAREQYEYFLKLHNVLLTQFSLFFGRDVATELFAHAYSGPAETCLYSVFVELPKHARIIIHLHEANEIRISVEHPELGTTFFAFPALPKALLFARESYQKQQEIENSRSSKNNNFLQKLFHRR